MESTQLPSLPADVIEAILSGKSANLEKRHCTRAFDIKCTVNGNVVFAVERHPHLLGRPTVGKASAAFKVIVARYEWDHETQLIRTIEEREVETFIDVDGLVAETMDGMREGGIDGETTAEIETWASEKIAIECARIWADDMYWDDDTIKEAIPREDLLRYVEKCVAAYADLLVDEWRKRRKELADDE